MSNVQTKSVPYTGLKAGNIVHFYGARFKIIDTKLHPQEPRHIEQYGVISDLMVAHGVWLDGAEIGGYFGSKNPYWTFQGNVHATASIEI